MPPYFMRNEQIERKEHTLEVNGLRRKLKRKPTSLTLAVYFSVSKPEQVAEFNAIHEEAKLYDLNTPTDYMRRLIRIGREEVKKNPMRLFMKHVK
jgi:hypothetical protein